MLYSSQHPRTIGAAVAHFLDMEGVTGSIPVSSTQRTPKGKSFWISPEFIE